MLISYIYSKFKKISFLHGCANIFIGFLEMIISGNRDSINRAKIDLPQKKKTPENMSKINDALEKNKEAADKVKDMKENVKNYFDEEQ